MLKDTSISNWNQNLQDKWSPVWQLNANYVTLALTTLVFHDYFITLPLEISGIWPGKLTGAKALFYTNRYFFLLAQLSSVFNYFWASNNIECDDVQRLQLIFLFVTEVATILIFSLRTFAIYRREPIILIAVGAAGAGVLTTDFWNILYSNSVVIVQRGPMFRTTCMQLVTSDYNIWFITGISFSALFDTLVFFLTLNKTLSAVREGRRLRMTNGITFLLLRDGLIYYAVDLLLTLGTIYVLVVAMIGLDNNTYTTYILLRLAGFGALGSQIRWTVVNRLVLNLSRVAYDSPSQNDSTETDLTTGLDFAGNSIIGDLGGPLRAGLEDDYGDPELEMDIFHMTAQRAAANISVGIKHSTDDLESEYLDSPLEGPSMYMDFSHSLPFLNNFNHLTSSTSSNK